MYVLTFAPPSPPGKYAAGTYAVCGVTEWVISGNEGTTEEGLLIIFLCMSVCLVFSMGEKIVLISIQVTVMLEIKIFTNF